MKSFKIIVPVIKPKVLVCDQRENFISGDVESYRASLKIEPKWYLKPQKQEQQKQEQQKQEQQKQEQLQEQQQLQQQEQLQEQQQRKLRKLQQEQ